MAESRKFSHHELHAAHAEEERRLLREDKVLQRWRDYGNSRVLPSIRSRDESSSRIRTLFWNYQAEYRNCKMKGNSHVTSRPMFPTSSDTGRDVEAFFRIAASQRRAAMHLGHTWYIGKRFCRSTCIFISSLSSRIESRENNNRGAAPFIYSGEK